MLFLWFVRMCEQRAPVQLTLIKMETVEADLSIIRTLLAFHTHLLYFRAWGLPLLLIPLAAEELLGGIFL